MFYQEDNKSIMYEKTYSLIKKCYWSLPSPIRSMLNDLRYTIVRRLRSKLLGAKTTENASDINVHDFEGILSTHKNIYVFELAVDWGIDLYQRPQHLATALGHDDSFVIYKTQGDGVNGFRNIAHNVWLTNELVYVDSLDDVKRVYFSTSIFNTCEHMIAMREKGRIFYEYIDHISEEISGGKTEIRILNEVKAFAFEGGVDHVVATADELHTESLRYLEPKNVSLIPNGVNVEHYQNIDVNSLLDPCFSDFTAKYDIIVGYFGAIAPWLWYELIDGIVAKNPNLGFVMLGPDYGGCQSKLPKYDNFLWLGPVSYTELPCYANEFDACWIPFSPGDIAKTTSPLKLFEYFALGRPVTVTSDMRECTKYNEVFHGDSLSSFNDALNQSFHKIGNSDYQQKTLELAKLNSWNKRAQCYNSIRF
ncbi:glycosyltransferase family 1 protein [Photobacterium lipolyticum]|nr:glycosyltransferase family 1 protein [Photobacterium lipolyticum]